MSTKCWDWNMVVAESCWVCLSLAWTRKLFSWKGLSKQNDPTKVQSKSQLGIYGRTLNFIFTEPLHLIWLSLSDFANTKLFPYMQSWSRHNPQGMPLQSHISGSTKYWIRGAEHKSTLKQGGVIPHNYTLSITWNPNKFILKCIVVKIMWMFSKTFQRHFSFTNKVRVLD